jgi:FimV-like protein
MVLSALLLPALLVGGPLPRAGAEETGAEESCPAEGPAPRPSTFPKEEKDRKGFKKLVLAARTYFDLNEELWVGRRGFLAELEAVAAAGHAPLADMPFLRWLVAQGRSFEPQMDDSKWYKLKDLVYTDHSRFRGFELKGRDLWMHVRTPDTYPKRNKDLESYERPGPWPVVFSMHGKENAGDAAGKALVDARWAKETYPDVMKDWFVAVPIVAAAAYSENGRIRMDRVHVPLRALYESYHIDFDRVVLDGGQDALLLLTSSPWLFAGAVLREGALDSAKVRDSVPNFRSVPLYVLGQPALAKALTEAGHPAVTTGDGSDLAAWLAARRRVEPRNFTWVMKEPDQQMAWWINIDQPNWDSSRREIEVQVVDTPEAPNTIRITAYGIVELSLNLNDDIVDLDRNVRVEINGTLVRDQLLATKDRLAVIKRDLDAMFQMKDSPNFIDVRKSRWYGWLRSAFLLRVPVPAPPAEVAAPVDTGPAASPKEVEDAARLLEKIKTYVESGDKDRARSLLERILGWPETPSHAEAREILASLDA